LPLTSGHPNLDKKNNIMQFFFKMTPLFTTIHDFKIIFGQLCEKKCDQNVRHPAFKFQIV
jgi:hypothetical protein